MPEDQQSTVDVVLCEATDRLELCVTGQYFAISWTTEHCVDDVFRRRVIVFHQQMLAGYWNRRACNSSHLLADSNSP